MKTFTVHPLAARFPMLPQEELEDLARDIDHNGLKHPIVIDQNEQLLDGRNRLAACNLLNLEPTSQIFTGTDEEAQLLILSSNVWRRHLPKSVRVMAYALVYPDAESPKERGARGGRGNKAKGPAFSFTFEEPLKRNEVDRRSERIDQSRFTQRTAHRGSASMDHNEEPFKERKPLFDIATDTKALSMARAIIKAFGAESKQVTDVMEGISLKETFELVGTMNRLQKELKEAEQTLLDSMNNEPKSLEVTNSTASVKPSEISLQLTAEINAIKQKIQVIAQTHKEELEKRRIAEQQVLDVAQKKVELKRQQEELLQKQTELQALINSLIQNGSNHQPNIKEEDIPSITEIFELGVNASAQDIVEQHFDAPDPFPKIKEQQEYLMAAGTPLHCLEKLVKRPIPENGFHSTQHYKAIVSAMYGIIERALQIAKEHEQLLDKESQLRLVVSKESNHVQ